MLSEGPPVAKANSPKSNRESSEVEAIEAPDQPDVSSDSSSDVSPVKKAKISKSKNYSLESCFLKVKLAHVLPCHVNLLIFDMCSFLRCKFLQVKKHCMWPNGIVYKFSSLSVAM